MFSGFKDATSCYNDQPFFENRSQASFLQGDTSKQTSGPPWDYSQQPFSTVPCYAGDQNMNHRHPAAIHNPQVVSQFENNSVLAHYRNISTGNNSHQSVVRPRAVINCQSNCNACYNHSVARVPHHWNPPPAENICYITGNSSAPLSRDEVSRFPPNLANFSQHEESSHHFTSGFATQLTKLSKFPKDSSPGISSTIAPKNDNLSPTEDCNVVRPQHCPSRVDPILEKYIPPDPNEKDSAKKDTCVTCHGACTRPNCKLYHQQNIKFPNLEPLPFQQYGVPRENVVRYTGHSTTLNGGSPSCNQWHQSPGLWLQNNHQPSFWMSASDDIHNMGNAGMTNFWSDRSSCEISGQQAPLPPNYRDMASNKPAGQGRNHLSLQQQKEGIVHEIERNDKLHQNMLQRYQKGTEVPHRYSEMSVRQKGPEETTVSQVYQELLPRRSHQHEAVVECGVQYRQDMVSRHPTQLLKSQMETQSNKNDRGQHELSNIASELCHQDITRSHISSDGNNSSSALPDFPPTSLNTHTDQVQRDISRKFPTTNFAAYLPHDTKVSSSSSANYSAVLGIAQPPSRFSSNLTYTQSKISRSNNYTRLLSQPCLEDSYNPSHSGDVLRNGFVPNSSTATANTVTSGLSHRHVSYHNRETPNTPSNSLPLDSIIRYGTMKASNDAAPVVTTSASVATSQLSPHLHSCGKMISDNAPPYQTGGKTMQVVENNPACSLASSTGLNVDPKLLNNSSYIGSPHNRQESGVAGSQHMPYQNTLAGSRSENVAACNTFCGNNGPMLHSHLFDDFNKNYSNTHISGPEGDMISQSSKENCQITSPNIYSQSSTCASTDGVKQQLLPLLEDVGASRPIKKRKPRTKGMIKPDQVQLVGKRWHRGRSSQQMTSAPVLDVRQFLATWDEETDDLSPAPRLPDVVLSNSSAENPLLVLDCRNLNANGMATLSTVDRNSLPEASPTKSLIHMYQPQMVSPSESSSASNDTSKSNTQTLQANSNDMSQPLGECPSLIPIDPDRMQKFGQQNNCIKSLPEHRILEQSKSSFHQTEESGKSTPNSGSENSVSKSGLVESLVEALGTSEVDNVHTHLDNVCTKSDVSDSMPLNEFRTSSESLPSKTGPFPEDCDSFHAIHAIAPDIDSQHCSVVQDDCRTNDNSCQNVQGKCTFKSKVSDCFISHQEVSLSCSKIQHPGLNTTLEEKHADCHQSRKSRVKKGQPLLFENRKGINTLKVLCTAVIERNTKIKQKFEKGKYLHGKTSNRGSDGKEIEDLKTELCDSLNVDKEVVKTFAENGCSVLKNSADISYGSDHNSVKDVTICVSESTRMPSLVDETNDSPIPKILLCNTPNNNNKVLSQDTEDTNNSETYLKLSVTCESLAKEKLPENTNACTTEASHTKSSNLTSTVNTKIKLNRLKIFDEALPPSSFNMKTLNGDVLLNTDAISTDSPASPYLAAEELSSMQLPQDSIEKVPVMTDEEKMKLKEQDLKGYSTEPVGMSENKKNPEDVNFSVTNELEKNHLSYASDTGEDLDMSVTSSTPTPVILDEVDEVSGDEELDLMYQDSALSDLESDIGLESDCISFSSLPCISKKRIHEDDRHSNHSLGILENLDSSHTLPGAADDSFPCLVEGNFDSEILSESKDEIVGMCSFKISGKTDNEKCVSVSCSQTKSLGNNTELSPFFKSSLNIPDSCSEDTQLQPIKSPPSQMIMVNHESDSLLSKIKDVCKTSDMTSDAALVDNVEPDCKTAESDEKVQADSEENNATEFQPLTHNSAVEACNILHGHKPTANALLKNTTYSEIGTEIDCIVVSKSGDSEEDDSPDSLICDTSAVIADSNQQFEDDNSVDKTSPDIQVDTSIVLFEELDSKLAENEVIPMCAEKTLLDASGKDMLASSVSNFSRGRSLDVGEEGKSQRKNCLVLNNNFKMLRSSSETLTPLYRSELTVSHNVEETLKESDEFKDSDVSTYGHSEICYNYGSEELEIEETGNEVSEVCPLQKGSACSELLELSENGGTASKSVSETTANCSKNVTSFMRMLQTSPLCSESVKVIQPYQLATDVKEMPKSTAVCNRNAESAVDQDCNSSLSTTNVINRSKGVSQINENNIDGRVPYGEVDSNLCIKLNITTSHNYNNFQDPQVSEDPNIHETLPLKTKNFSGVNGKNKLPITAGGNKNEQNHNMNSDSNSSIEEPQNKNLLFVAGAKSARTQVNILNSQQTTVLNSSVGHSETSNGSVREAMPHDHLENSCEPESAIIRIPCEGTAVADHETLWNVEPINFSKNAGSKCQGDNIPEEKLISRNDISPYVTESQNVEYLQRNFSTDICRNEQKNGCGEDDAAADDYRNTSSKEPNIVRSMTDDDDDDDDGGGGGAGGGGNDVTAIAATIDGVDHDDVPLKSIVDEEHLDDNYSTDINIADVANHVTTTTSTTNAVAVDDGVAVNPANFAITTDDESDTNRNMGTYASCKDKSNVPCQNVVQNVMYSETFAAAATATTITAATTTITAAATTTTTTTTTTAAAAATTTSSTTTTTTAAAATTTSSTTTTTTAAATTTTTAAAAAATDTSTTVAAAATTTTTTTTTTSAGSVGTGSDSDTADEDDVCINVTATGDDVNGVDKRLVNCTFGRDWQHDADIHCSSTNQIVNRTQKAEHNDTDLDQRHITSMITSGSVTLEKENAAKISVGIVTTGNQECCQPERKLETTQNFRLEQTSESSGECNHNQYFKFITICRKPTNSDDVSHNSNHIEHDGMIKPHSEPESIRSKSQQQDEPNQEKMCHCEMDTAANCMKPLQQCHSATEPTKDVLNNYMHELHDESHALSLQKECTSVVEMHKDKINNCALDMSSDVLMQQEEHHCLEELIKDEICNSELNIPSGTLTQHEWNSTDKVIKDEISCEINITSVNTAISHDFHTSLELNKEEIGDFKIKTPENVSHSILTDQNPSEGLNRTSIAKCILHMSADSSLKEEHLSLEDNNDSISDSEQNSPVSGPGLIQNRMTTLENTEMTVELMHNNVSAQNSPYRQETDLSVGTEDMPHLEVIDTDVSPYSSDSLEMPCLDLIADPVQPMGSHQVQYSRDICPSASNIPPLHNLPVDEDTEVQENLTESRVDAQRNDSLTLEVAISSPHSLQKSKDSKDIEMPVLSQNQVTNSVDSELLGKKISMLTTSQYSFRWDRISPTKDGVVQKEPSAEGHGCENSSRLENKGTTRNNVIQKESSDESHGLSPSLNSDVLPDDHNYLSPDAQAPVMEECDGALEKAVECEMHEASVTPETLQVLTTYLDSETDSMKVVEVEQEYMEVLRSDATDGWEALPLVTSDLERAPSGEISQKHTTNVTADEELVASTDVGETWPSVNLEEETSLSSAELSVCSAETDFNIEGGAMYSAAKENEALIFEHSENVTLSTAALQDTSDDPSYSEMLPGLDPSLGDVLPVDSVSNWPYLEEEVFSEFPAGDMDSSNSLLMVPSSSPVSSIPISNNGATAESEASMSSGNSSQYNFITHSGSNDKAMTVNSLKCCLSWKKIFALSKADKKKKKKHGTKNGVNSKVAKEFYTKARQQFKEYPKVCYRNDGKELNYKCEMLNGNLKSQHDLKNKRVRGLELGPAKIEVRLAPTLSLRGHPKTWQVVDGPKSEIILNQGKPNNIALNASAGNNSCSSVAKDVGPLPSGLTQSPIVLVKRLILKRRSDDDSDADSDIKRKTVNQEEPVGPDVRNLDSNNFIQVSASSSSSSSSSEQMNETCDAVALHCEQLEDSEHSSRLLRECSLSNSSLMTGASSSQEIETQAGGTTDSDSSESEEDRSSHISVLSSSQGTGRKSEVYKSGNSSSITLSEEDDTDGIDPSANAEKIHDISIDDSKHVSIYSDISFNELGSTNSSVSGEDNAKQQLPKVIIKRTVGMDNTNKYRSFLRSASSCSISSNQWQPFVRLERNLSLDELAKSSTMDNEILEAAKVPDSLRHGLRISLRSPPNEHHVTLVPLPSLAYSSVDRNRGCSEGSKKKRCGTFLPRMDTQCGNLNDGWNPQRYARRIACFKSSFCVKHDKYPMSIHKDSGQLSSPESCTSHKSHPIKLKFFSNCNRMQNGALKTDRNKTVTGHNDDEYIVVENRNYTSDSMTKITFQRHRRKEVSDRKGHRKDEMKEREFVSNQDISTALNQKSHGDILTVRDVSAACSEDSNNTFNLTTHPHGTVKRRLSIEHDRELSKTELHRSYKKHMSDVSHDIASSRQEIVAALEDTGNMVSDDCSQSETAMVNDKPCVLLEPAVQSVTASKDYGPKISTMKKRHYFEDMYHEEDVPPLFQPERILSVSSTKKKRTNLKEKSPQLDGKSLEEEIIRLSAESQIDYSEIISKELTENTDAEAEERQDFSTDGSIRMLPCSEECAGETGSSKDAVLLPVSNSEEPEPELHKLNKCGSECVGNSTALKTGEQQTLCNNIEHIVVESPREGSDSCQACGLVYNSYDERTTHIRRHPYHCQRCHLAFRSEVDFVSHLSEQHPRTRERHHCLLCERSFPTAERYRLHLSGRTHRHLELTQRRTIHTLFSVFTGHNCPVLTPLSDSELAGLKWFPVEPGTIHFYHQATPLQRAMQDLLLRKEANSTDTARSNFRISEGYPSKSSDSL